MMFLWDKYHIWELPSDLGNFQYQDYIKSNLGMSHYFLRGAWAHMFSIYVFILKKLNLSLFFIWIIPSSFQNGHQLSCQDFHLYLTGHSSLSLILFLPLLLLMLFSPNCHPLSSSLKVAHACFWCSWYLISFSPFHFWQYIIWFSL